jgi:hypothetical protein
MSSLTGRRPESLGPGSKERKSALTNLAADLELDVDFRANKPMLGSQMAYRLGKTWDESCWSAGSTITLEGLNRILTGAEARIAAQRRTLQPSLFEPVSTPSRDFAPARSKLEAVTRISALTSSPPEELGPGSKERKTVLVNLASGLGLNVGTAANKPEMGDLIARSLDVEWDDACWSAGHTITLEGLNRLLAGAERRLSYRRGRAGLFYSAAEEGPALLSALRQTLPAVWDGPTCVAEMQRAEYSQWAQDEWAAFYFEYLGLPALVNAFGGGPRKFANTRFDYSLGHPWDLKVHMAPSGSAPLNDQVAMTEALDAGAGVGFLVLTGDVEYDEGQFRAWQKEFRAQHGKAAKARTSPPKYVRKSKRRFEPRMVEAFFVKDRSALHAALANGSMTIMRQGKQTSGAPRPPKYAIDLVKARFFGDLLLTQMVL